MIEAARRAGSCATCDQPIVGEPWLSDGGRGHHLACALRTQPLQLARALATYTGDIPERGAFEQIARLWSEVVADPDDDSPRLVLADLLQTRGDPRGELIALQLAGAQPDRCDTLIEEHGAAWLWRQRRVALAAQFGRGFLTRLQLSRDGDGADPDDPTLGTVEDLAFASLGSGPANGDVYARYVCSPAMRALRRIEVWDEPSLAAFEDTSARIVHVGCELWKRGLADESARFVAACARQPALRSLAVSLIGFETIATSRVFAQLDEIAVVANLGSLTSLWPKIPETTALTLTLTAKLAPCYGESRGRLQLRRVDGKLVARVSGEWIRPGLIGRIPNIARLVVEEADPPDKAVLGREARAARVEVDFAPAPTSVGRWLRGM